MPSSLLEPCAGKLARTVLRGRERCDASPATRRVHLQGGADTRKYKPSQTDPFTAEVVKKPLSQRTHALADGRVIGRDEAAALVMLRFGVRQLGREPAWGASFETPARAA